jgi:hypothetical protein
MSPVKFAAERAVDICVPLQPIPIGHYLRQPHRLIRALVDANRIVQVSDDEFCLTMRTLSFFNIELQPTVYLRVWAEANGTVRLESTHCEIRGIDYVDRRFNLDLVGAIAPYNRQGKPYLEGLAQLQVQVDLPAPLNLMPKAIVETAGNSLLAGILLTFKQRLNDRLIGDYVDWVKSNIDRDPTGAKINSNSLLN